MSTASLATGLAPWLIIGTVPDEGFGLVQGPCVWDAAGLAVGDVSVPVRRGTPALLAAACAACQALGIDPPQALLAGDAGCGQGSGRAYKRLVASLPALAPRGLTFHYLFPDLAGHDQVLLAALALPRPPLLVADAGFMYAAKMSGQASDYDLFTPDAGELAFLADELAPHPFYTRGFLLGPDSSPEQLIRRAWDTGGSARHLLVKGRTDRVARLGAVLAEIPGPQTPAMEAIGGTGDTLTGMVTALLMAGQPMLQACTTAALANRLLGQLAQPTPATPVSGLVPHVGEALRLAMAEGKIRKEE